ncbi:MAG: DUF502 domain-containing protein [Pseudomonadota bacterium]
MIKKVDGGDSSSGPGLFRRLRGYLLAGLLIWLPLGVTIIVLRFAVAQMDRTLGLIPQQYRDELVIPYFEVSVFEIPGIGLALTILILLVTGLITANFFGRKMVKFGEAILERIPLVRTIYSAVKNFAEIVLGPGSDSFKKVLLIEYPRKGVFSLAFQTSTDLGEIDDRTGKDVICTFVPTTPNPTSGFIIMVPREDVIELDMEVDQALKMIISLGVVVPPWNRSGEPTSLAPPEATP